MRESNEEEVKNTAKFDDFLKALRELCVAHNVVLSGSDYASLRVWDREMDDDPINATDVEDHTTDAGQPLEFKPE